MSWLSSALHGDFSPLEGGVTHLLKQIGGHNTIPELLGVGGVGLAAALPFLAPELLAGIGGGTAAAEGGAAAGGGGLLDALGLGATDAAAGGFAAGSPEAFGISGALDASGNLIPTAGGLAADSAALPAGATLAGYTAPGALDAGAIGSTGGDLLAGPAAAGAGAGVDPGLIGSGGFNFMDAAAGTPASGLGGGAVDSITGFASAHPYLTTAGLMGGAVLGAPMLSKLVNPVPQQGALNAVAGQAGALSGSQAAYGTALEQPLLTGKLPPDQEQSVQNATNDAISSTKARYAALGLTGSTMEADAISNMQNQASGIRATIEQQMAQTGLGAVSQATSALGIQDQVYAQLMNAQVAQDTALQQAIARMAAGAALGSGAKSGAGFANAVGP